MAAVDAEIGPNVHQHGKQMQAAEREKGAKNMQA